MKLRFIIILQNETEGLNKITQNNFDLPWTIKQNNGDHSIKNKGEIQIDMETN